MSGNGRTSPYDQRLARLIIRPFARTWLHPNHVTIFSLLLGAGSGVVFALGPIGWEHLAALLFMCAVLVDHMDGELARLTGKISMAGHYLDYVVGSLIYTILFCCLGVAFYRRDADQIAFLVGLAAGLSNLVIVTLRLALERRHGTEAVEHPHSSGFEIEDFIYLIGPIIWLGGLTYFFWVYAVGTLGYLSWIAIELFRREVVRRECDLHLTRERNSSSRSGRSSRRAGNSATDLL